MTTLFDGMAGMLNDVFGAPVELWRAGGKLGDLRGILRSPPVEAITADGRPTVVAVPVLRLPATAAPLPQRGDTIRQGGRQWRVLGIYPSGSPAGDHFLIHELEIIP
jgi:hypothetical protein